MASVNSIQSLILDLPPSCIEFCPAARDYFVVGTYFLERKDQEAAPAENTEDEEVKDESGKKPQTRTGSLILFKVDGDRVTQVSTTPTPYAILDIHFSPHDPHLLAVAASTGLLQLFRFDPSTATLTSQRTYQFFDPATLVLSLAWHPTNASCIGVTVSTGEVYLCCIASEQEEPREVLRHDLEAWTLSFSPDGDVVFSGGDDAALRFAGNIQSEEGGAQWMDRRIHQAGVTAILPLRDEEDVVVTGSYDDHIRVLKAPQMGRRQVLAEENLEGGVWRLKMLVADSASGKYTILASCMHAGARIVKLQRDAQGQWQITVLAKFEEHKSMNYGSDVQPESGSEQTIISTSFYDKLLCLWRFELS